MSPNDLTRYIISSKQFYKVNNFNLPQNAICLKPTTYDLGF